MNEPVHLYDDLLVKVMLGEASPEERQQAEDWVAAHPDNHRYYQNFRLIWESSKTLEKQSTADPDAAWVRFKAKTLRQPPVIPFKPARTRIWWAAAAAAIVMIASVWWFFPASQTDSEPLMALRSDEQVRKDTLPDGSVVTLNKHSSLTYAPAFGKTTVREVNLTGEAFFDVRPDKSRPFTIHVNEVTVTVLGTSFNIRSNAGSTEVIVETGLVQVANTHEMTRAWPGEKVIAVRTRETLAKEAVRNDLYSFYRTGKLVCRETPLHELVSALNEAYDADIVIGNPTIRNLRISTVFEQESLPDVLNIIRETLNIKIINHQNQIILQ